MIVGIDSMVLIYAGVVPQKEGQCRSDDWEQLCRRSKILLDELAIRKATIVLPTIAIAELLVPVPQSQKGALVTELNGMFYCPPFDVRAASMASSLWSEFKELPADSRYESRHVLKADAMIVGTAKSVGASRFYSHDNNCRRMADLVMEGYDLPSHSSDLFWGQD